MIPNIGPMEVAIVLLIVLIVFGPKKLPSLGRSVGGGIREFRSSVTEPGDDLDVHSGESESGERLGNPALRHQEEA